MIKTACLQEAKYLLERAIRTRGLEVSLIGELFCIETPQGRFTLQFMPGNRRVLISSKAYVHPLKRNMGYGRKLLALREELAKEAGVNLLLATVRNDNRVQTHLLSTSGWKTLINRATTDVSLWSKELE